MGIHNQRKAPPNSFPTLLLLLTFPLQSPLDVMTMFRVLARRAYATHRRLKNEDVLSLDAFLQRKRVISLYRTILRGIKSIEDKGTKAESRKFAPDEFERHRGVKDLGHIRYLLSTGKTEWENMERYIGRM